METFILGFKYVSKQRFKCQLIHFLFGLEKLPIYVYKIEQMSSDYSFLSSREVSYINRLSFL